METQSTPDSVRSILEGPPWVLRGMEADVSIGENAPGPQRKAGAITAQSLAAQGCGGEKQPKQVQVSLTETQSDLWYHGELSKGQVSREGPPRSC